MLVKICGNRYFADSLMVARFRPDFMGWIFSPKSARRISVGEARLQLRAIRAAFPEVRHMGVFAANSVPEIGRIALELPELELLQIGGGAALVESYKRYVQGSNAWSQLRLPPAAVPSVRVSRELDDNGLRSYGRPPFFQLDAYVPGQPGGTGHRLQGQLIEKIRRPFLLAGGLNPDNVAGALAEQPGAIGADVSSGLEYPGRPGRKDPAKVAAFVSAVRGGSRGF